MLRPLLVGLALLAIVGWTVASRAAFGILPLGPDQGLYITIGEIIKHGGVPWRDAWDNKPPGTYYLYAAALTAGPDYSQECALSSRFIPTDGFHTRCAQIVLTAIDALWTLATVAAVWWIGRRTFGSGVGMVAALLCAYFISMAAIGHGGNTPDSLAVLPGTLAVAATLIYADSGRRSWLIVAGALAACAVLFKQTAGVVLLSLAIWVVLGKRSDLLALLGGASAVFALTLAVFAHLGALPDMTQQTLLWNERYVAAYGLAQLPLQAARQSFKVFTDSQAGLWLAALGALALLPRAVRGSDRRSALLLLWAAGCCLGLALGGARFFQYYYVSIVAPLSVAGGWALVWLWQRLTGSGRLWLAATSAGLVIFCGQLQARVFERVWYERLVSTVWTPEEFVGGSIKDDRASLFVWGNGSQVYALAGGRPASRFLHTLALSSDFGVTADVAQHRSELMSTLQANPPDHIALDTPWLKTTGTQAFPELDDLISREYVLDNNPSNPTVAGWQVYRRKG
ncbi:MAG: glycosyltransferase family 39 protein [Chloroflexi bacterium]|nr:glycosyltransferase family 39 protein [Chloroflexota bacterium]